MIELKKEVSDQELKYLDENLKNAGIDRESKIIIHKKILEHEEKVHETFDNRSKDLEEKMSP